MLQIVKKNLILLFLLITTLYLISFIYFNPELIFTAFQKFSWHLIPFIFVIIFLMHTVRFFRWKYFLKKLEIELPFKEALLIHYSSLIMELTPGKLGEMIKPYLVKVHKGVPISKTSTIVIAERITEFVSLVIIASLGIFIYGYNFSKMLIVVGFILAFIFLFTNKKFFLLIINYLDKIPFFKKYIHSLKNIFEGTNILFSFKPFINGLIINILAWSLELIAFYIILIDFNFDFSIIWSSFVFSLSIIFGAISMLPGGLGTTDGSLTLFLIENNIDSGSAVVITFITRMLTLWLTVFIGIIASAVYSKLYKEKKELLGKNI